MRREDGSPEVLRGGTEEEETRDNVRELLGEIVTGDRGGPELQGEVRLQLPEMLGIPTEGKSRTENIKRTSTTTSTTTTPTGSTTPSTTLIPSHPKGDQDSLRRSSFRLVSQH